MIRIYAIVLITICLAACEPRRDNADTAPSASPGAQLFVDNCARCHQVTGQEARHRAVCLPRISAGSPKSPAELREIITFGFGKMPSFKDSISDAQISEIAEYVAAQIERHAERR